MSGYNGYSKSNNAVYAEENNCFPASILAQTLKVSTDAIKSLMEPSEWHHTSSWFNSTDYYNGSLLIPLSRNSMPDDCERGFTISDEVYEAAELLVALRNYKPVKAMGWVDEDCEVEWIEWSGSRRRPKAIECTEKHCRVEFNGKSSYKITLPSGHKFTKRAGTNGFYVMRKLDVNCKAIA